MIIVRNTVFLSAVLMPLPRLCAAWQAAPPAGVQNGTIAEGANYTYTGNDVNAYRRDSSSGSWNSVDTPTARQSPQNRQTSSVEPKTIQNLNQSWQSRERGDSQTQEFRNLRSSGGRFRR